MFEATIYFEDAVGNVDSVVVGYDTLATTDIDPEFGEEEITTPFDSVFEVRAGTLLDWMYRDKLSKKIIEPAEYIPPIINDDGCYGSTHNFIYVWAKHQPVTVSWKSVQFMQDICDRGSVLVNHWTDELAGPYTWGENPDELFYCMAVDSSFEIDLSEEAIMNSGIDFPVFIEKEVEGKGTQTIYGLRFFPSATFTYTPCYWVTSDTREEQFRNALPLSISPNPANTYVSFQLPQGVKTHWWEVYNVQGRLMASGAALPDAVSLENWASGIYFARVQAEGGVVYTGKIVKQ